ncbi:hypothetical protein [Paenibacillus sp. OV219]|uniref:hypothetical protein n=1 Tax=Paenibacillus sp. OV219 TaxID=1884377 RepID=UPI0008B26392|nr:hypothetical protein [Paenibacillus sp. OV219]SEN04490.1 hypothetical protein SAMN05518847_10225 [Paenibacillus sp. OV219]
MAERKKLKLGISNKRVPRGRRRKSKSRKNQRTLRLGKKKLRRKHRFVSLVSANRYNRFFLTPHRTIRLKVERRIWDRIAAELPPSYLAPDIDFVHHMKQYSPSL